MSQPSFPPPISEPEPPPALTPEVLISDDDLAEAVDAFIHADREARQRLHELVDEQERLCQACEPSVWQFVLHVDELVVARWADLVVGIARSAFLEGQRHPAPPSKATAAESGDPPQGAF